MNREQFLTIHIDSNSHFDASVSLCLALEMVLFLFALFLPDKIVVVHLMMSARYFIDYFSSLAVCVIFFFVCALSRATG